MLRENNSKYVWWADEMPMCVDQLFDTEEEACTSAVNMFRNLSENEVYFREDYVTGEPIPIVNIGIVEKLNLDDMTDRLFGNMCDAAYDYICNFASNCDDEPEFSGNSECNAEVRKAIRTWLEKCHIRPSMLGIPMYEFDCLHCVPVEPNNNVQL